MTWAASLRTSLARRDWPIAREPRRIVGYLLLVGAAAGGWGIGALLGLGGSRGEWAVAALLLVLATVYGECAQRAGRRHLPFSTRPCRDTTPAWSVAAAAALPADLAVLLVTAIAVHRCLRDRRPSGPALHQLIFRAAATLLACLTAGAAMRGLAPAWDGAAWMVADALAVAVVIAVHAAVHRLLVVGWLLLLGVRGAALFGAPDDNINELGALCLGGFVALAAWHAPWLAVLALPLLLSLQRGALVRELEAAATLDAKTGLLNAVAWEQLTRRELARGRRHRVPVGILIIDIDRFKLVNDRFGHLVGDDVLRQVGACLQSSVREFDSVGRFGGEEFVVVLPEASATEARVVAERLRSRINELRVTDAGADEPMSVSIGVACSPGDGTELADLLVAADGALYEAKASGRNCVVLAEQRRRKTVERIANV